MKLYYDATAAPNAAWEIPGQQQKKAERVDVPTTPISLVAWLNERCVPIAAEPTPFDSMTPAEAEGYRVDLVTADPFPVEPPEREQQRREMAPGFCAACGRSAAGALKLAKGEEIETVVAWVPTAELWQLQRVAEAIREHIAELGGQIEERSVQ